MQRYKVSGIFIIEVEAEKYQDAKSKAERILCDSGISGYIMEVDKVREDN